MRQRNKVRLKLKETGTWKTCLFLCGSQLGLWKCGEGQCETIFSWRKVRFPFSFSLFLIKAFLNQHLDHVLMNQGNYSSMFWSVCLWCFFSIGTAHSCVCYSPLSSCWVVSSGHSLSVNLDLSQDAMPKDKDLKEGLTQHPYKERWNRIRPNNNPHQIKPVPLKRAVFYTVAFITLQSGKQTMRHLGGNITRETVCRQSECNHASPLEWVRGWRVKDLEDEGEGTRKHWGWSVNVGCAWKTGRWVEIWHSMFPLLFFFLFLFVPFSNVLSEPETQGR